MIQTDLIGSTLFPAEAEASAILQKAYEGLHDGTTEGAYGRAVVYALRTFFGSMAPSIEFGPTHHFLLHGLNHDTLDGVVGKISENGRIMNETFSCRDEFLRRHEAMPVTEDIVLSFHEGNIDMQMGIEAYVREPDDSYVFNYMAKIGFFIDKKNSTIYVLNIQGQMPGKQENLPRFRAERGRAFARLTAKLGEDPRSLALKKVMAASRNDGFHAIRAVRSSCHPLLIGNHKGFTGKYDRVILSCGFSDSPGPYYEARL